MLVDLLLDAVKREPGAPAVADRHLRLSYRKLAQLATVFRSEIERRTDNHYVGLLLPASAAFPAVFFGGLWAGRRVVPLNFLLAPEELVRIVEVVGLDVIYTVKPLGELAEKLPARVVYLEDLPLKRRMLGAMLRGLPQAPSCDENDTAVVLFTSGTSTEPKGVELSFANLARNCDDCIATAKLKPGHRFLNCLPPFHVFGLTGNVLAPVALGARVYCVPRFSATAVAEAIVNEQISIFLAIPAMYQGIVRLKSAPSNLLENMYIALSGGEPLSRELAQAVKKRFGCQLLQGFGLTETSPVCTLELPAANCSGSVGRPIRNVSVRIADAEGRPLPANQEGEIWIQGPNVMKGYFRRPDDTRHAITEDGWFRTGDAGHLDDDGFLFITGRIKEMLIVGGENVFPREIETVLIQHPAVSEVAVVGAHDTTRGEVPVAFVIIAEGQDVTDIELREFARKHLAGYKTPRQVCFVEDLPRGPTGKVLRRKLRESL